MLVVHNTTPFAKMANGIYLAILKENLLILLGKFDQYAILREVDLINGSISMKDAQLTALRYAIINRKKLL